MGATDHSIKLWTWRDSNTQQLECKSSALPIGATGPLLTCGIWHRTHTWRTTYLLCTAQVSNFYGPAKYIPSRLLPLGLWPAEQLQPFHSGCTVVGDEGIEPFGSNLLSSRFVRNTSSICKSLNLLCLYTSSCEFRLDPYYLNQLQ